MTPATRATRSQIHSSSLVVDDMRSEQCECTQPSVMKDELRPVPAIDLDLHSRHTQRASEAIIEASARDRRAVL